MDETFEWKLGSVKIKHQSCPVHTCTSNPAFLLYTMSSEDEDSEIMLHPNHYEEDGEEDEDNEEAMMMHSQLIDEDEDVNNTPQQQRSQNSSHKKQQNHASAPPSSASARCNGNTSNNMPASASTPVTMHFDALLECLDLIASMEEDDSVDKQDVIDSLRSMLNNMLSTVMMHSFSSSMSVRGWRVQ